MNVFRSLAWLGLLTCSLSSVSTGSEQLLAGAASVDISPQTLPALHNGGFIQKKTGRIADPLHARALVLSDGSETVAIVIVDTCMFPTDLCDQIKQIASRQIGIKSNRILISATHTHSAPSAMDMCLGCSADNEYVKFVPAQVAKAIVSAHRQLRPAKIGWAVIDGSDLTHCRRWITRSDRMGNDPFGNKTIRAMMHPGYENPNYTSPAGPIDPWLSVLSVKSSKDDSHICLMANLSMHYFGGGAFSADYFGDVARVFEKKLSGKDGNGFVGIMSQGTSGDLHWMDYSKYRTNISRQTYAQSVADRAFKALKDIKYESTVPISMAEKRLTIQRRIPSKGRREWARPINMSRGNQPPRNQVEVYAQQAEWIHQNPTAVVVLQALRIGDLGITATPNEVYGITGLKLKRQSPLETTFNLELANGATGYIPPPEQHKLGGYTTWPARTAGLDEKAEPLIVETLLTLLETVSGKRRKRLVNAETTFSAAIMAQKPVGYWRLEDMVESQVIDDVGGQSAEFNGGVALFLPGSKSKEFEAKGYGNRSVYLAGGQVTAKLNRSLDQYSFVGCFSNFLPANVRPTTGTLFSTSTESLFIGGRDHDEAQGKLVLKVDGRTTVGKHYLAIGKWHQIAITRSSNRIRVFLDGSNQPEIDVKTKRRLSIDRFSIGSDGNAESNFDGKVDELALFDRELSKTDVVELYAASGLEPPPQPKPVIVLGSKPTDKESRARYAKTVLSSKPVGYWRLHDDVDRKSTNQIKGFAAEFEANAFHLTGQANPNFRGGRVATSLAKLGNTYSVELWFRNDLPFGARPVTGYVFSRAVRNVEGAFGDNLGIGGTHSNSGRLFVFNGNEKNQIVAGNTILKPGSWCHVVMIRENQKIKVYLNGNPNPEIDGELPIGYPEECHSVFFGGRSDNFANLNGMLEEVAIYDRVLKPMEVKAHFEAGGAKPIKIPGAFKPEESKGNEPKPVPANESVNRIHVPDGFEVHLVAAEPMVKDPVAIDWGPDGKLWVVEMADYPLGMDNKGKPGGRVRFLEDTNRNGHYDTSTLFAEGLNFPTGVLAWGKGILVTAAPEIRYLEDADGDGKADINKVLYSGFLEGNQQLRLNGLRWGLDNWIHCASGGHYAGYGDGSQILSHLTKQNHPVGSRDFRIRAFTGDIEPQSGPSQYGRNRDDWGNWFGVQNSHPLWHYVLHDHEIRRNAHYAPPSPKHFVVTPANPKVYPVSKLQKRFHSFQQSGRFTSACSAIIYRDELLFSRGNVQHAFTCEPFHNLVQHNIIHHEGVTFGFRRDPKERSRDFFASEDRWCRPVMVRTGPDGALWIVDMYRYMIEHPQWLPKNGRDELRPYYRFGDQFGRIYKIVPKETPIAELPHLNMRDDNELVASLTSPNGWIRDTAHRMLLGQFRKPFENGNSNKSDLVLTESSIERLKDLVADSKSPLAKIHALSILAGGKALPASLLENACHDSNPGVRRIAVRIAALVPVRSQVLAQLVDDPNPKVRLQLAATLGEYESTDASQSLARIISNTKDSYTMAAAMSSLHPDNVASVLSYVMKREVKVEDSVVLDLVSQCVSMGGLRSIEEVVSTLWSKQLNSSSAIRFLAMSHILDELEDRKLDLVNLSPTILSPARRVILQAREVVEDDKVELSKRVAAISLLARHAGNNIDDFKRLNRLLVPQSPPAIQIAVIQRFAKIRDPEFARYVFKSWDGLTPTLRGQIVDVVSSRPRLSDALLEKLKSGEIDPTELSAQAKQKLLQQNNNDVIWQNALATRSSANRAEIISRFKRAVKLEGDIVQGKKHYQKLCLNCHKVNNDGFEVGPNLHSLTNKTKESIMVSILDPSAAVDSKYLNYKIATVDGRLLAGKLESETGSSITLLAEKGKKTTVLRRDIEQLKASNQSVMPEGLEQELSVQDLADLIEYVRQLKK